MSILNKYIHHVFFLAFLILAVAFSWAIVHDAIFVIGDQHSFIGFIDPAFGLEGIERFFDLHLQVMSIGRFWPFYSVGAYPLLTSGLDTSFIITGLFLLSAIRFLIALLFIWLGIRYLASSFSATCVCLLFLLMPNHLFNTFAYIELAEAVMLCLWAIWFYCYSKAWKSDKTKWYVMATLAAAISFGYKETSFILFFPSTLILFVFGYKTMTYKHKIYNISIMLLTIIYLGLYYWFSLRITYATYNEGRNLYSFIEIVIWYIRQNILILPAFLVIFWRALHYKACFNAPLRRLFTIASSTLARKKNSSKVNYKRNAKTIHINGIENPIAIVDILLINGLAFILAYPILGLQMQYYIVPAEPLILIGLFFHARDVFPQHWFVNKEKLLRPVAIIVFLLISILGVSYMWGRRHNNFEAIRELHQTRQHTREGLGILLSFKNEGYTFISYLPQRSYFYPNVFQHDLTSWWYVSWHIHFRFFYGDSDFQLKFISTEENDTSRYIVNPAWLVDEPLPSNAWLVTSDKYLLESIFERYDNFVLLNRPGFFASSFEELPIEKSNVGHLPWWFWFEFYFSSPQS